MILIVLFFILLMMVVWKKKADMICTTPENMMLTTETPRTSTSIPQIDDDMNGATIQMRVGGKADLVLSGNATTGYAWRIVKMEGVSVASLGTKWHYELKQPFLIGSGGYFKRQFQAIQPGITDVYLIYDPVSDPQMGYDYFLQFDVRS